MDLKIIHREFSICKLKDLSKVNFNDEYCFLGKTEEEISLVCDSRYVPKNYLECENGWRAFRIQGILDFSLVGILSKISTLLADSRIGIFAISTYNTDYILVKEENWNLTVDVLSKNNYNFID
jgi:hypothetical protein